MSNARPAVAAHRPHKRFCPTLEVLNARIALTGGIVEALPPEVDVDTEKLIELGDELPLDISDEVITLDPGIRDELFTTMDGETGFEEFPFEDFPVDLELPPEIEILDDNFPEFYTLEEAAFASFGSPALFDAFSAPQSNEILPTTSLTQDPTIGQVFDSLPTLPASSTSFVTKAPNDSPTTPALSLNEPSHLLKKSSLPFALATPTAKGHVKPSDLLANLEHELSTEEETSDVADDDDDEGESVSAAA